jgi:hypothetical protein
LQNDEVKGLLAKMQEATRQRLSIGPPMHDGLFVERTAKEEVVATAMTEAVAKAVGVNIVVRPKEVPKIDLEQIFRIDFDSCRFRETEFVSNEHLASQDEIDQSLDEYNRWLSRFFVSIVDEVNLLVAQVYYFPNSDRVQKVVCRTPQDTIKNYADMDIFTIYGGQKRGQTYPLLVWYLRKNLRRHTKEHVEMWTSPEDIANHPNDLNIFGGLMFDERFNEERHKPTPAPFADPFPRGALPRAAAGLKCADQTSILAPDADWRRLEGLA